MGLFNSGVNRGIRTLMEQSKENPFYLILDSIDDKISSREASAQLNLKNMRYDLYKRYQLKITDLEDEEIIEEYDFNIRFNNF